MVRAKAEDLGRESFFSGMSSKDLTRLASAARRVEWAEGHRIFGKGEPAERFWLIGSGEVSLDLRVPGRGDLVVETLGPGTVLGWSWMVPPHRWRYRALVSQPGGALEFDGRLVRTLCAADPSFGYRLTTRLMSVLLDRMENAREHAVPGVLR
ncbi:cyclic nucleotide-binding domain-containing protein [Actinomadura hibisca]|uniref:cyclic nucleotide-binding domain-containing protein n=1 Tax=Actinomadura hibisca TaxID=68565 RepID=UPI000830FEA8|nr:cyclic nucleotide-binding domain-containing protein [Actinomadura hibisca]